MSECVHTKAHTHTEDLYHFYCVTQNSAVDTCPLFPMTTKGSQYLRKGDKVSMEPKFVQKE